MAELWDLYDINHRMLGKIHERGVPITAPDEYHLVAEIMTFDRSGRLLITQRARQKATFPLMWEFTGGSVLAGEDSLTGARRELFEETGIRAEKDELVFLGTETGSASLHDLYYLVRDVELSELTLQPEEVCAAKWADEEEIAEMVRNGVFLDWVYERYKRLKGEIKL